MSWNVRTNQDRVGGREHTGICHGVFGAIAYAIAEVVAVIVSVVSTLLLHLALSELLDIFSETHNDWLK